MRAKKSLGQHFLKSPGAIEKIVQAGELKTGEKVLEIGPGTGALTRRLLATGVRVVAVEKDNELYLELAEKYQKETEKETLTLIHEDILDLKPEEIGLKKGAYKLIANIPYNLTGLLVRKFLETDNQPSRIVFLLQKEVARRIVSRDKQDRHKENLLSIAVKSYGKPKYVGGVPAGSFSPAPKVDSAIVAIENISKEFFARLANETGLSLPESEKHFFELVRAGFKAKRKKLLSNISDLFDKTDVSKVFQEINLEENIRAEDVDINTWYKLSKGLLLVKRVDK